MASRSFFRNVTVRCAIFFWYITGRFANYFKASHNRAFECLI